MCDILHWKSWRNYFCRIVRILCYIHIFKHLKYCPQYFFHYHHTIFLVKLLQVMSRQIYLHMIQYKYYTSEETVEFFNCLLTVLCGKFITTWLRDIVIMISNEKVEIIWPISFSLCILSYNTFNFPNGGCMIRIEYHASWWLINRYSDYSVKNT